MDYLCLFKYSFDNVQRHRTKAAFVAVKQVTGCDAQPAYLDGNTDVDDANAAVRYYRAGCENLELGRLTPDTGSVSKAAIRYYARRAELAICGGRDVPNEATSQTIVPNVLDHYHCRLGRRGYGVEDV